MKTLVVENPYPGAKLSVRYNPAKSSRAKDKMVLLVTYGTPGVCFAEVELVAAFLAAEGRVSANDS